MRTIKLVNEEIDYQLELNVLDNWSEITLENYFKILDVIENKDKFDETEFFIHMICIISNIEKEKLYEIPVSELMQFTDIIISFNLETLSKTLPNTILIDDITYVSKKNMSNLTTNEMIWIKNKQKESKNSYEIMINILTILLRPGYQKTDEIGQTKWIQAPYDDETFQIRKELFLKRITAYDGIPLINFFLSGNNI
jgi:hypothetical protein